MPQSFTPDGRIPPERVEALVGSLFDRTKHTGTDIARRLGVKNITLWSWFQRRGIPVEYALRVADVLHEWAVEFLSMEAQLRKLAREHSDAPPRAA